MYIATARAAGPRDPNYYVGQPLSDVLELGKLVIQAGTLEFKCHEIAKAVNVEPSGMQFAALTRQIERQVSVKGLPTCQLSQARVIQDLIAWMQAARTALDERNSHIHATTHTRDDLAGNLTPERQHIRSGAVLPPFDNATLVQKLEALNQEGRRILMDLLHANGDDRYFHDYMVSPYPSCLF